MFKYGGAEKFRRAALQVFKINFLGLEKREPVRQLKKAGGINENIQQSPCTHPKQKYKNRAACNVKISERFI